jgi:hypothetical protein
MKFFMVFIMSLIKHIESENIISFYENITHSQQTDVFEKSERSSTSSLILFLLIACFIFVISILTIYVYKWADKRKTGNKLVHLNTYISYSY